MFIPPMYAIEKLRKDPTLLKIRSEGVVGSIKPKCKHKINLYKKYNESTKAIDALVEDNDFWTYLFYYSLASA